MLCILAFYNGCVRILRKGANPAGVMHSLKSENEDAYTEWQSKRLQENFRRKSASTSNHIKTIPPFVYKQFKCDSFNKDFFVPILHDGTWTTLSACVLFQSELMLVVSASMKP